MRVVKLTSLAAAAALVFGAGALIATPAYAESQSTVIDGITYTFDDDNVAAGAIAADFDHSTTTVEIPDSIDFDGETYDVVTVGGSAFVTHDDGGVIIQGDITSVVIGDNVTWIAAQAFMNNSIESLTLGASLATIGGSAFMSNNLTQLTIPDTVGTIAAYAFAQNPALTTVEFTGPAPYVVPATDGPSASFDSSAAGFIMNFPEEYGVDNVADGYTTPEWEGYPTQAIVRAEFSISKTVDASYVRLYDWTLEKTGTVGEVTVGENDASADVVFTVTAIPAGFTNVDYSLSGVITVTNETVEPRTVSVTDVPEVGVAAECTVEDAEGVPIEQEFVIGANEQIELNYDCTFDGEPSAGTNTATVTWGDGSSSSVTENVEFEERGTQYYWVTMGDDQANPDEGFSEIVVVGWNTDHMPYVEGYTLTFDGLPLDECTTVTNTAIIYETEQVIEATVDICPESPVVTPDPDPTPDPEEPAEKEPVLIPNQASDPEVTPTANPESSGLAQTGSDTAVGRIAIAVLLLLAGSVALARSRRHV